MAATYEPIASQTLGSDTATVTFSGIAADWTDLIIVFQGEHSADADTFMRLSGDTGSNYSRTVLTGNGSAVSSSRNSSQTSVRLNNAVDSTQNDLHDFTVQIMSYANTNVYKTTLSKIGLASDAIDIAVGLWRDTGAVTSIDFFLSSGNFKSGSTFSLFGIEAA